MDDIVQIVESAKADFAAAEQPAALEDAKARYLGKNGSLTALMKGQRKQSVEEKRTSGQAINRAKGEVEAALEARREALNRTIHARFYDPATQTYATGSQLEMTYPMLVGATPDSLRAGVEQRLFRLTHDEMKDQIGGGLVGVTVITR